MNRTQPILTVYSSWKKNTHSKVQNNISLMSSTSSCNCLHSVFWLNSTTDWCVINTLLPHLILNWCCTFCIRQNDFFFKFLGRLGQTHHSPIEFSRPYGMTFSYGKTQKLYVDFWIIMSSKSCKLRVKINLNQWFV